MKQLQFAMPYYCLGIIISVWMALSSAHAQEAHVFCGNHMGDIEKIEADPRHKAQDSSAIAQLMQDAEIAMGLETFSVVDNPPIPPGGSQNDYYSWAPYWWPDPQSEDGFPYISKDGETNPETEMKSDKPLLRRMAMAVHTLALAYIYTQDHRYAHKAAAFIRRWFLEPQTRMNPNLNYAQCIPGEEKGKPSGIIDTRWLILVVDATVLLDHSGVLTSTEEKELKLWFEEYVDWLLTSKNGQQEAQNKNNHGSWYAAQTACFALYAGKPQLTESIVENSKRFFATQQDSRGRQIHELNRTKSFDYSLYNIHALITLAMIAAQVNVDLWHYTIDDKNLYQAIRFMAESYYSGEKWPYQQISERAITLGYEDGLHFSVYYPYDLYAALRIGYKVYQDPLFLKCMDKISTDHARTHRANLFIQLE